jgi:hypothetical protein
MLQVLTTEPFAAWFNALEDETAEAVATAIEIMEQLGPARAVPGSRESLLWYEHPMVSRFGDNALVALGWRLDAWGSFHDYVTGVLRQLESPRFVSRLARLDPGEAAVVLSAVKRIRRVTDPRLSWSSALQHPPRGPAAAVHPDDRCAEVRRWYFEALAAAGLEVTDIPAHSHALRELSVRLPVSGQVASDPPDPNPSGRAGLRLLYGVDVPRATALVVLGEQLNRAFYGDSVRRAESLWRQFLDGILRDLEPAHLR